VTSGTGLINSFTSTYQNIAVDLTVTPLIGNNGDIQLTIDQKVDDIGGSITIQAGDVQPIIDHREMKSFITVKDGEMIVLGGLQKTNKEADQSKIGFLYEIRSSASSSAGTPTRSPARNFSSSSVRRFSHRNWARQTPENESTNFPIGPDQSISGSTGAATLFQDEESRRPFQK